MDILRPVRAFDAFQQRHTALAIPMAVLKKFADDQAGSLAALVAYYAFFSFFLLMLVLVTILGFVLQGDPAAQRSVENSVLAQFPIAGVKIVPSALRGSVFALIFGVLTSLWSGLGVTNAAQQAFDRVWAVPFKDRPDYLHRRLRGLGLLVSLGLLFVIATGVSGAVTGGLGNSALVTAAGIVVSLLVDALLFLATFRLMTARIVDTRSMWIGVVVAAVFWEILQVLGGVYVGHALKHFTGAYAHVASVIGLLIFLHLGAQLTLYAAEINVVLKRRLYPRSLFAQTGPADRRTLEALAKVEQRDERQRIDVHFLPE